MDCQEYPLDQIAPDPHQPRKFFDEAALAELIESVKTKGVLQPIVLTPNHDAEAAREKPYVILYGERRYRAATAAGLRTIPAVLEDRPLDPAERLARQLAENDDRSDLTLFERATSIAALLDTHELSRQELAERLRLSKSWVSHMLAIAEFKGPALEAVSSGVISRVATARRFARLPESLQKNLLGYARSRGLQVTLQIVASAEERHQRLARARATKSSSLRLELSLPELHHLLSLAGLALDPTLEGAADALKNHLLAQVPPENPS